MDLSLPASLRFAQGPRHVSRRRPSPAVIRRRRLVVGITGLVVIGLVVLIVVVATSGGSGTPGTSGGQGAASPTTSPQPPAQGRVASTGIDAVEAGILPWSLPSPVSRASVLPGTGTAIVLAGGADSSGAPVSTISALDMTSGATSPLGTLQTPVGGAAATSVGKQGLLFGGTAAAATATVQAFASPAPSTGASATLVGHLPDPRSGASAVTIGHEVYLLGGDDGSRADAQILSTSDGKHFETLASLPVPVGDAGAAAVDGKVYVFGGEADGGKDRGKPVDVVQMFDPATNTATVVGHLPNPAVGAVAAVLDGHLYVAGGSSVVVGAAGTATGSVGAAATSASSAASSATSATSNQILAFDTATDKALVAGTLPVAVAYPGVEVVGTRAWLVGGESNGSAVSSVEMFTPNAKFGTAGATGAGSPFYGDRLLVADRGNNRLLLLNDRDQIVWTYPSAYASAPPGGFYFPDDAFFAKHGTEIISNQEQNETIVIIGFPSGQLLWQYGHPLQPGTAPGYLHEPDDAYLLKNGQVTIADAQACRVLVINPDKTIATQIGTDNVCEHDPPNYIGSPNGDTPLADGNLLISEITGSWVSEWTTTGQMVWAAQLAIHYPSDPQQIGPDLYLISDYYQPGGILEFNRAGQILYDYAPASGPGELNQPSLTELLPSGVFMTNDDYNDRMVAIDPATQALVWQYGVTGVAGTAAGMLNTPDGFDLLLPDGTTPTHTPTA
jgi:hypothetical protein